MRGFVRLAVVLLIPAGLLFAAGCRSYRSCYYGAAMHERDHLYYSYEPRPHRHTVTHRYNEYDCRW